MNDVAKTPPKAPRLPVVGNALTFLRTPLQFLRSMCETHGDVVEVALGPMEATLVSDPDMVEDILVTRNRLWQKDIFLQTSLRPVLGQGLLSSEGDFWRRQRRLAQPAFHRDRIASYATIMVEHASRLAGTWRDGEIRNVHEDMMRLTLEIVAESLFGARVGDHAKDVGEALHAILAIVADPLELFVPWLKHFPTPRRRRFRRAIENLDRIIYGVIEERRRSETESDDLLSMLLHAKDEDGSRMSDKQLRDECMTLFLAGHETTAIALSWTWHLLSKHPEVEKKLAQELANIRDFTPFGRSSTWSGPSGPRILGDRAPVLADIPNLRTTGQIIQESLRMYPPAWSMGREAREDVELKGFRIRKGTQVWFCPWSIQRDPRWFADPNTFRPERWEGDLAKTLHRYAYFPFGGGPRLCIGQSFAQMEAVLILAVLARRFRVEVLAEPIPDPSVTLRPKHGVKARLHAR
jgi:cytochrome P450